MDAIFHLRNAERALRMAVRLADGSDHRRRSRNLYEQTGRLRGATVRAHDMVAEAQRRELTAMMEAAA
jgi:hypothetical protein